MLAGEEDPLDILADVALYYPNFILQGPEDELRQLDWAKPGEHIEITGTIRVGTQQLRIMDIKIRPQVGRRHVIVTGRCDDHADSVSRFRVVSSRLVAAGGREESN